MNGNDASSTPLKSTSEIYYGFSREEIAPLLPKSAKNILEVGASSGRTLSWLKSKFPESTTTAVELNEELLPQLQKNVDTAIIGPIDSVISQLKSYDLILLLDVLEHLNDSLSTLKEICNKLTDDGQIIVSLPNVAHLSVSLPLLFQRKFEYKDAGILDRTHKVFFTETSAVQLMNNAGLIVIDGLLSGLQGPKAKLVDSLSFGGLKHHLTKQYIMGARKKAPSESQTPIGWKSVL
jgi:2-polyprenyl-3-methyl-5-hydroxy-6-metoxy-1,4-benzoquinol methylase